MKNSKYNNEVEVQARARRVALDLGVRCNLTDELSLKLAKIKVKQYLFRLVADGTTTNPDNITATAYLLEKIDSFCPDRQLYGQDSSN
ncbi:MAG: hypothetical protein Q8L27_03655 [archaeon]|nr:hypothetical protein [archaeon]